MGEGLHRTHHVPRIAAVRVGVYQHKIMFSSSSAGEPLGATLAVLVLLVERALRGVGR